jgi:hypothetical protein
MGDDASGRALELHDVVGVEHGQPVDNASPLLSVIKMKLNSFCKDERLSRRLNAVAADMDRIVAEAYLFANFHVLRLLDTGLPVPVLDRQFFYRCLVGVSNATVRATTLTSDFVASFQSFDALAPGTNGHRERVDATAYNQVIADMSITMATMASNHLWMNLERRLEGYLKWAFPHLKACHKAIVVAVAAKPKAPLDTVISSVTGKQKRKTKRVKEEDSQKELRVEQARSLAAELRLLTPLPSSKGRAACRAVLTLPLYRKILQETELAMQAHKESGAAKRFPGRVFHLLPMKRGYTSSHVPVSSMMLKRLLRDMGLESFKGDGREVPSRELWSKYFNLNAVETRNRRFDDRICTDGYAVGIQMAVKAGAGNGDDASIEDALRALEWKDAEVLGLDPGISDVFTGASSRGRVVSMSSSEYYHLAKFHYSTKVTRRWNAEVPSVANAGGQTADLQAFAAYASRYLATLPTLLAHRRAKGYRKLRFLRYRMKSKAIDTMCERLAPRDHMVVIGFGDWHGPKDSPISRRTVGPLAELKAALRRRPNVRLRMVDEFNTSRTDCETHMRLVNMKAKTTRLKRSDGATTKATTFGKVHKVLHCRNSDGSLPAGCRQTTWNRDVNAAQNMLKLLQLELRNSPRPEAFVRARGRQAASAA